MRPPHGPYRISSNGQVVLGKEVLASAGLTPGDNVYLVPYDDPEGSILVLPVRVALRWLEAGRAEERQEHAGPPTGGPPDRPR